jgi:hypothetical protein
MPFSYSAGCWSSTATVRTGTCSSSAPEWPTGAVAQLLCLSRPTACLPLPLLGWYATNTAPQWDYSFRLILTWYGVHTRQAASFFHGWVASSIAALSLVYQGLASPKQASGLFGVAGLGNEPWLTPCAHSLIDSSRIWQNWPKIKLKLSHSPHSEEVSQFFFLHEQ